MLLEFYGTECPHCREMVPLIEQLKSEEGIAIEQFETWHNAANAQTMRQYDTGLCGGVPFFFNTDTKQFICGGVSYEELKAWAIGES